MRESPNSTHQDCCKVKYTLNLQKSLDRTVTSHVAETVKVPQMAESISEGTLKTWHKQPGDSVEADEEIATIETDKVCYLLDLSVTQQN